MKRVVFIGAGNVATSMAAAFKNAGWSVAQVYSRTIQSAELVAKPNNAEPISSLSAIITDADLYVVAMPDSTIASIAGCIAVDGVVVHTSGSTPMSALSAVKAAGYGVLYPFQTFSRSQIVSLASVPIFIEANTDYILNYLSQVGRELSSNVSLLSSEKRMLLHLSGVFACNFTNHILALAYRLAIDNGIDFKVLQPLVEETIRKAFTSNPKDVQTGPAIRNDQRILDQHSALLIDKDEQLHRIYNELSLSIQKLSMK